MVYFILLSLGCFVVSVVVLALVTSASAHNGDQHPNQERAEARGRLECLRSDQQCFRRERSRHCFRRARTWKEQTTDSTASKLWRETQNLKHILNISTAGLQASTSLQTPTASGHQASTSVQAPMVSGLQTSTSLQAPVVSGLQASTSLQAATVSGLQAPTSLQAPTVSGF